MNKSTTYGLKLLAVIGLICFTTMITFATIQQKVDSSGQLIIDNDEEQFARDNGIDTRNFQNLLYNGYISEAKLYVAQANMNAGEVSVEMQIETAIELIKKAHALKLKMDDDKE